MQSAVIKESGSGVHVRYTPRPRCTRAPDRPSSTSSHTATRMPDGPAQPSATSSAGRTVTVNGAVAVHAFCAWTTTGSP